MTRIIIEGVGSRAALLGALSVVMEVFNTDRAYEDEERVFVPSEEPDPLVETRSQPPAAPAPTLTMPLVACPKRGQHDRITECWMCWSDVMRGAALEPEVLAPGAWSAP